jgi:flagellar motor switch protein FliG
MNYDRSERIRRAAILVASLEETLAEQMLASLPPAEAEKILEEVDRLGELEQEELRDVLDEFRAAGRRGQSVEGGVEFTYSVPSPALGRAVAEEVAASAAPDNAAIAQQEADAALMAELLSHEHPQTIAAALSRLGPEQGAAIFARLPLGLQTDVLDRLASLEPADEDVVQELEQQLQRRVEQQRERRDRATAATELARRMLEKTPVAQRDALLARLSPPEMRSPAAAPIGKVAAPTVPQLERLRDISKRFVPQADDLPTESDSEHFEAWTGEPASSNSNSPVSLRILLEDRSADLESLDDRSLLEALRLADERTVQCALAASSEKFLNRVAGKLPRRQAQRLRQMVRSIGPTRLTELREAQYELLRLAHGGRPVPMAA